jgi:hypothetical protein
LLSARLRDSFFFEFSLFVKFADAIKGRHGLISRYAVGRYVFINLKPESCWFSLRKLGLAPLVFDI